MSTFNHIRTIACQTAETTGFSTTHPEQEFIGGVCLTSHVSSNRPGWNTFICIDIWTVLPSRTTAPILPEVHDERNGEGNSGHSWPRAGFHVWVSKEI